MSTIPETVYLGRDNQIDLELQEDGVPFGDHTAITRAVLLFGNGKTLLSAASYLTIDSQTDPAYFDFTNSTKLILKLGSAPIPVGRHNVRLVIYTAAFPNGAHWEPGIELTVR